MFRKRDKEKTYVEIEIGKCIKEFDRQFTPEYGNSYAKISELYNYIKKSYEDKIDSKEIDISVERLRLKRNLGSYHGNSFKIGWAILGGVIVALISFAIQVAVKQIEGYGYAVVSVVLSLITLAIIFRVGGDINKVNPKDFMIYVSLKVLDDIEKEKMRKSNLALEEVAVTELKEKRGNFRLLDKIKKLIF